MSTFSLGLSYDRKKIVFHNKSSKFVEVVFDVDGMDACEGKPFSLSRRGYAIPPEMEKNISKLKSGNQLSLKNQGTITAYIFDGKVRYKDGDIDLPAFLRPRVVKNIHFTRSGNEPIQILKMSY